MNAIKELSIDEFLEMRKDDQLKTGEVCIIKGEANGKPFSFSARVPEKPQRAKNGKRSIRWRRQ